MARRKHTFRIAAGLLATGLALTACGGSSDDSSGGGGGGSSDTPAAGGELLIWVGTGPGGDATTDLGKAFGEENGVDVKVEVVPGDKLQAQFVTAAQAGDPPDVVMGAHDWIGNLVQNGTIDPIQIPEATASTLQPLALEAVTFDGQTYGMPYTMNNIVLMRNTDMVPDAPATVEDMVAAGEKAVSDGKAQEPLAWPVSDTGNPYFINPLYTSGGGYMFGQGSDGSFDPADLGVATPGAVTAYEKIGALGEKGSGVLKRSINTDNAISLFTSGKTPFLIEGPWQLTTLDDSDINYEVSAVPGFEGMDPASPFITVDAAYVASGGANKTLAQEFVTNYWSRADVGQTLFEATKNVPANTDTLAAIEGDNPAVAAVAKAGADNGQIMPSIPQMAAVWDPLGKAEAAVIGGADPDSTIKAAAKTIEAAIK
ncbi:carbohydrate ABC transporter substrate-binding protein, CUT1 family [Nocardioides exalbidus]|uniref:Carbohydrate ABC transporter substrate-binding protein, CUT1 family n=1 Tax=Nocardioides exalbidus TaxID=402596 RepID=A0A1H4N9X5_9ACTN|nr:maltose ABC transporter substrate-binding protein [Nocardioides exalbidus]SEB92101.1 carbohydrate ABC transporter substrate-binding protein, CUT1 family [Nocardioides exalbidus]